MTRRSFAALLTAACAAALGGCSTLSVFAAVTPKDPARKLAGDMAYGPNPRQTLDVYAPKSPPAGPMPVVMFFYGGNWDSGSRAEYGWVGQALASRGFLVIVPDYRLTPQVVYPSFVEDCAAATRWAQDHAAEYGGDPSRLLLTGHSAGAYMAVMLALDDGFLRKAGVDYAHVKGAVGLSGPYDFYPFDVPASRAAFAGYPDPKATQPIAYAARPHRPPVLMIQGEHDKYVGPHNAINLDRDLKAAGNPSTLRLYPTLTHPDTVLALSVPFRGKAPILDEVTAFLRAAAG